MPSAVKAWSPNHCAAREFPVFLLNNQKYFKMHLKSTDNNIAYSISMCFSERKPVRCEMGAVLTQSAMLLKKKLNVCLSYILICKCLLYIKELTFFL